MEIFFKKARPFDKQQNGLTFWTNEHERIEMKT